MTIKNFKTLKTFFEDNKTISICEDDKGYKFFKTTYHIPVRDEQGVCVTQKTFYNFDFKDEPLNILIYRYKNNLLEV